MIGDEPDDGRRYSEQALALASEIGDRFNIAIGQNNLGNALRQLRECRAAAEQYAAAVEGYQELDDRWGFAFLLEDVALLAAGSGQGEDAFRLLGAPTRCVPRSVRPGSRRSRRTSRQASRR